MENATNGGHTETSIYLPLPLASALRTKYPSDIKTVAMMSSNSGHILANGETSLGSDGCRYVEPQFLDLLSLDMIRGDHHALDGPGALILDRSLANALFGKTDPIGKTLKIDNREPLRVTGVYEDLPTNVLNSTSCTLRGLLGAIPYRRRRSMKDRSDELAGDPGRDLRSIAGAYGSEKTIREAKAPDEWPRSHVPSRGTAAPGRSRVASLREFNGRKKYRRLDRIR